MTIVSRSWVEAVVSTCWLVGIGVRRAIFRRTEFLARFLTSSLTGATLAEGTEVNLRFSGELFLFSTISFTVTRILGCLLASVGVHRPLAHLKES